MSQQTLLGQEHDCYFASDPRQNPELSKSLEGRNVVLAGAGRGIGRACALFMTHASVRSLSLMALELDEVKETADLCREINPNLLIKVAAFNVTNYQQVENFIREADTEFNGLHVLLMNAGRPPQWLPTAQSDPSIWWDTVAVSLQGGFNFSRAILPIMQRQGEGRIIFTSSSGAHANYGMGSYIVGKLGLVRLCEIIHHENFKEHNIKCFAFNPGCVRTRFFTDFKDRVDGKSHSDSYLSKGVEYEDQSAQNAVNILQDVTPDTPELPAGLVTVIASGKLDFMSGRYLDAAKHVEDYQKEEDSIRQGDLYRVRLHAGPDHFIPHLDY
ncbi:uncharacterized protein FMAN_10971 [Fusarium mangiferae]|uniref:NAD(P)-binding protein n=1 Tax=Fusarium mangiferae TaxID=192010 RepID=A0A1L7TMZ2_FUSMA|nr:uncharacterized protein FMAN_10971 [Fusarium mangiferae]CVK96641.1 uncharacterized protein FMAN_10971 [Fusarium mangiferae]